MRTKPFSRLREKMTLEQRVESETRMQLALLHFTLSELRKSLNLTQEEVADNSDLAPVLNQGSASNAIESEVQDVRQAWSCLIGFVKN